MGVFDKVSLLKRKWVGNREDGEEIDEKWGISIVWYGGNRRRE